MATGDDRFAELLDEFGGRRDEAYGAWVVERALRARVERRDTRGPGGLVDAEVLYPDRPSAGLEFTSVEPQAVHALRGRLSRMPPMPSPGTWTWTIHPGSVAEVPRLQRLHARVIELCERHGARTPGELPFDVIQADPDLRWLAWEGGMGRMAGHPTSNGDPVVYWWEPTDVAVIGDEGDAIATGLSEALKLEPCVGHIAKLLRDPHSERHLFLLVGSTGLSTAAAFSLLESESVPSTDPDLPDGLDHLWLSSGMGGTVTVWSRGRGWRVERIAEGPPEPRRPGR